MKSQSISESIKNFNISGNERVSDETIIMFSDYKKGDVIELDDLNIILKNIYNSNFFENVNINFLNNTLSINVVELPIIQEISFEGIKAKKIKKAISQGLTLKQRSSYNKIFLNNDIKNIKFSLQNLGYYFSDVSALLEELEDNKVNIIYKINLGKKAKIKKIKFVGDKKFKDKILKNIITSEEYKFWKFISGKKFLNKNLIEFDRKLLTNFYLNKGYYNVEVNSSYATLIDEESFELIFNINANNKFYFDNLTINLPRDFNVDNFKKITELFSNLKNQVYSINKIEQILDEIDQITLNEEFENISADVEEKIVQNKINLDFKIQKSQRLTVEKINIFGNNVTRENVIRNQFEIDEGDPFNEILNKKTENNLKSLGFFKTVKSEIKNGSSENSKIINISVEEKPTGEIGAGAGFGTDGASFLFSVSENNYLGKGIKVSNTLNLSGESIKGSLSINNPNIYDTNNSAYAGIDASETDRLKDFGYKTNKYGFNFGTAFEIFDDTRFGLGTSNYYEKISTNSTASARQKKQAGDYWDSFVNLNFDYDKRDQKFQTTDGFRSRYFLDLPLISDTNTLSNSYTYQYYTELFENNRSNFTLFLKSVESISGDDVKLSERIFLPARRLKGFEKGKVGPKDGGDYIGGNYATSVNFASTIPYLFENSESIDFLFFIDAGNVWGVDYDSSIDNNSKIRSSTGIGLDWLTPVGPLNFTLAETISKADTDVTETFRFNIGTTF
ncbi:outer membrane protein assembly factor BamA [Candidatus Pelagibacter sp. HIMB1542]|uniref:outer membrane protein assembly factor BamA n=1 Tax=Candidatus Pelagibacter sp. HIMB1542 TaxID=3413346 RepID=UPI003F82E28C